MRSLAWLPHAIFAAGCALVYRFTYDDAYIYLRVLHGPPLAGNGVASYAWVLFGALGPVGLKVASFLSGIVLLRIVQSAAGTGAACVVACFPGAWLHGVSGMETMAAAALLAAVYRFRDDPVMASAFAVGAGLIRIEVGCAALILVPPRHWRHALFASIVLALYVVAIQAAVGPYAPAITKLSQHHLGVGSVAKACAALGAVLAVPALAHRVRWVWLMRQREWIAVGAFLVVISIPRHLGGYGHRLVWPVVPLVILLMAPVLWRKRWATAVAVLVAIALSTPTVTYARWYARGIEAHHALAAHLKAEGVTRIAATDVGILAYESAAETLDLLGLTSTGHPAAPWTVANFSPERIILILDKPGGQPRLAWERPVWWAMTNQGLDAYNPGRWVKAGEWIFSERFVLSEWETEWAWRVRER